MHGRIWTVSNGLSVLRILLVYPIIALLSSGAPTDRYAAAGLIVFAACTDFLDGLLARSLNQVSDIGKVIDPIADKLGIGAVAVALALKGALPVWFLLLLLARDVAIFFGGLYVQRTKGVILQSTMVGKWAAGSLAVLILGIVLDLPSFAPVVRALLIVSVCLLVISFGVYARRFVTLVRRH